MSGFTEVFSFLRPSYLTTRFKTKTKGIYQEDISLRCAIYVHAVALSTSHLFLDFPETHLSNGIVPRVGLRRALGVI